MPRMQYVMVQAMVPDNYPDQGLPGPQPPFPGGGGGGQPPYPDQGLPPFPSQGLPGSQPRPDQGLPPFPSHPIYIPITPPPDSGLSPEHPIYIPVYPDNSLPGDQPYPDNSLPGHQPYPDQGLPGSQPHPSHPIVKPGMPGWEENAKAQAIKKIVAAVKFWTGNLPPQQGGQPQPTPVGQQPPRPGQPPQPQQQPQPPRR